MHKSSRFRDCLRFKLWSVIAVIVISGHVTSSAQTGTFLFTGSMTNITVSPGTYDIAAYGARGGFGDGTAGAFGAKMEAQFSFGTTTSLTLLVGGAGTGGGNHGEGAGGGGGGSFVVSGTTPLVVSGGGGGGCYGGPGIPGSITTSGSADGNIYYGGAGGSNGSGGSGGAAAGAGGGGGGFNGNGGGIMISTGTHGGGGSSYSNGGSGGSGDSPGGNGGYGGGGGAGGGQTGYMSGAGGAGGYSGGGGGGGDVGNSGGGGGGSIIDSSAVAIITKISGVASPDDSPNGEIIITAIQPTLRITELSNTVTVYWPAVYGWSLQQNTNLADPSGWIASSGVRAVNGTNYLTIQAPIGNFFFRLRSQ